jgi:hypothetical protein
MVESWKVRLDTAMKDAAGGDAERMEYVDANVSFVSEAIIGRGLFSALWAVDRRVQTAPDPSAGAHAVANIASAHVPMFVRASLNGDAKPYKNGYDLGRYRVGDSEPGKLKSRREAVDSSLPLPANATPADIYFTAVELNGTGIRFYGDVALLLRRDRVPDDTSILDRNSWELTRYPIAKRIREGTSGTEDQRRRLEAAKLAGKWGVDLSDIASIKALERLGSGTRQWTLGQISDALLVDEDYIEVLLINSFSTHELHDARTAADDAAYESLTADRCRRGPAPRFESMLWRHQRRNADAALQTAGVPVRVVVTSGRARS